MSLMDLSKVFDFDTVFSVLCFTCVARVCSRKSNLTIPLSST